jgi:hypothetical protein
MYARPGQQLRPKLRQRCIDGLGGSNPRAPKAADAAVMLIDSFAAAPHCEPRNRCRHGRSAHRTLNRSAAPLNAGQAWCCGALLENNHIDIPFERLIIDTLLTPSSQGPSSDEQIKKSLEEQGLA